MFDTKLEASDFEREGSQSEKQELFFYAVIKKTCLRLVLNFDKQAIV